MVGEVLGKFKDPRPRWRWDIEPGVEVEWMWRMGVHEEKLHAYSCQQVNLGLSVGSVLESACQGSANHLSPTAAKCPGSRR